MNHLLLLFLLKKSASFLYTFPNLGTISFVSDGGPFVSCSLASELVV